MSPGLTSGLAPGGPNSLSGDAAFGLQADIDDGEFVGEADDPAGDDGAVEAGVAAEGFVEEGGEVFAPEMVLRRARASAGGGGCCHVVGCVPLRMSGRVPGGCRGLRASAAETRLARGGPRAGLRGSGCRERPHEAATMPCQAQPASAGFARTM